MGTRILKLATTHLGDHSFELMFLEKRILDSIHELNQVIAAANTDFDTRK